MEKKQKRERERFSSRLGFILISAGCAIGLGNVWRFPYVAGEHGGGAFVLLYLFFLVVLGLPILIMEFAVGRGSRRSCAASFAVLEPSGSRWHHFAWFGMIGNYLLMMFYTTVAGWILCYAFKMFRGDFLGLTAGEVATVFQTVQADWQLQIVWMLIVVALGFGICLLGLEKGVERITKVMMLALLLLMVLLVGRSLTLDGALEGLRFYLVPDFGRMWESGLFTSVYAAMSQAFFTLSIGVGSMAIFGSYLDDKRSLTGESVSILCLDTFVAVMAGLIIFPACFAFGVDPAAGPGLVFVTLPNIFNSMVGSRLWGGLFFIFMSFAALSTVIAVFENIIAFGMDLRGWSRRRSVLVNLLLIPLLSLPCVFGYSLWSGWTPLGAGSTIMDLEDFLVSGNLLPLGSLIYVLFCTSRRGWGYENFLDEANRGSGLRFPSGVRGYVSFLLPVVILFIFIMGYYEMFFGG